MPTVSICLPTLNRGALLEKTLRSLVGQSFRDLEIVVLDNASDTDDARRVVEAVGDPRVRFVRHERRIGMGANWNSALALGTGRFKAIFHDDDIYEPQVVEREVEVLERNPRVAFVHTATRHFDEAGNAAGEVRFPWPRVVPGREFIRGMALDPERSLVEAMTVMARAEAWQAAGPFLDDWVQATDAEMWLRLAEQGDVAYLPEALVNVRVRRAHSPVGVRQVQAISEQQRVAARARTGLGWPERGLARARSEAALLRSTAWLAVRGDERVRVAVREQLVPAFSPGLRALAGLLCSESAGATMRRAAKAVADLNRRRR